MVDYIITLKKPNYITLASDGLGPGLVSGFGWTSDGPGPGFTK